MQADEIRFVKGRLKFGGAANNSATFPSVVVVFRWKDCQAPGNTPYISSMNATETKQTTF